MDLGKCDKVLVISDTHVGSNNENMYYWDLAYDFAIKNGITKVIHGGDLLDGHALRNIKYRSYTSQIKHFINDYPKDKSIVNYHLYGNHDYYFIKDNLNLNELIDSRKDFINIGTRVGYLTINKNIIKVSHKIKEHHIPDLANIKGKDIALELPGHSHIFKYGVENEDGYRKVNIPTLSDNMTTENYCCGAPGFLVLSFDHDNIVISRYIISNDKEYFECCEHAVKQKKIYR